MTARGFVAANLLSAAIGFAQGVYVARVLGAENLAVVGVLASALAIVANFADVRPGDLASKLFYERDDARSRAGVVKACIALNVAIAGVILAGGSAVAVVVGRAVLEQPVGVPVALAQAFVTSASLASGTPIALLRLTDRLGVVAAWRVAAQLTTTACVVTGVVLLPDVTGYYAGAAVAALVLLPAAFLASTRVWKATGVDLRDREALAAGWRRYRSNIRFLVGGSIFAYAKMLHRGADTVVVAAVSGDVVTGVYRFSRSLTDGLYVVFDAISQVHFPRLLALLGANDLGGFRRQARRLLLGAISFTLAAQAVATVSIPLLAGTVLEGRYPGLVVPVAILVAPFAVVSGVHLWLWAALVHRNRIGALVGPSTAGAVLQIALVVALTAALGESAAWGALAYLAYYLTAYSAGVAQLARRAPELLPLRGATR